MNHVSFNYLFSAEQVVRNKELALLANEQAAPPLQAPVAPGEADIVVMPPAAELAETNLFISMCQIIIFNLF